MAADPALSLFGKGLPADYVEAEQRRRILAAVSAALVDRGFEHTSVEDIIDRAGVSRPTFYAQFDDRLAAFRAAYDEAFGRFLTRIESACAAQDWPHKVVAAIGATLDLAAAEPEAARLITIEAPFSGRALAPHHYRSLDRISVLLRRGRDLDPDGPDLPPLMEEALLGGICGVIGGRLRAGERATLPSLAPQLTELALTPYIGAARASHVSHGGE